MKTQLCVLAAALTTLIAGHVQASDPGAGKTRDEVRAELAEAIRTGDIVLDRQGRSEYERAPHRYPERAKMLGKTREQVGVELAEAIRTGSIVRDEQGRSEFELAPHRYPERTQSVGKTREQVKIELAEAIRLGDTPIDEQGRTPAQRFPHLYATVRAEHALALKQRQAQQSAQSPSQSSVQR